MSFHSIFEKLEDTTDAAAMQSELIDFAKKNADVVDVLILDEENSILFSAKGTDIAKAHSLNLERDISLGNDRIFMADPIKPEVIYHLISEDDLIHSFISDFIGFDSHEKYGDAYFFGANSVKTIYSLAYARGESDSNKTFFIFDISPIANGTVYVKAVAATAMLFFMIYWVLLALFVYTDAAKSKLNHTAWGILTLFTNIGGLIIYRIYRQNGKTCFRCKTLQGKANLYCAECGAKIAEACNKCGGLIHEHDKYCRNCGKTMEGDRA